ncbi:hypothetical protein [Corynebacterium lubricantis]|uniref:hypothetical protein n=1 Tax=Corynebacterium lubricantis TaxID=541095 RepID=UPI00035C74DB|nr:hypothetical protein [Corynebacterium lubricantis]
MTIINGEPARVCIFGDGWGTNVWAAGPNTSCKFVVATHHTLVEGQNATENNIRDFLRSPINVQSPVTGEYYDLTCAPESAELFACRGGNDAVIYFY